jgi:hypothetical protein
MGLGALSNRSRPWEVWAIILDRHNHQWYHYPDLARKGVLEAYRMDRRD